MRRQERVDGLINQEKREPMNKQKVFAACAVAAAGLAACGGGGGGGADPAALASSYTASLARMNTASGLTSTSAQDQFASTYLDAGMTKAQVVDALSKDAAALAANGDFSLFPMASVTDVSVGNCSAASVCTMTGTLTNADVDTTSVSFATQIVLENGAWRLYGDQKSS